MRLILDLAFVLLLAIFSSEPAIAWGSVGHRAIADLAYGLLSAPAETEVQKILTAGTAIDLPSCNFGSFEDASVWPDCVRGRNVTAFRYLRTLHYEDRPLCGAGSEATYCPDGACLTKAITTAISTLRQRGATAAERAVALAELVHFMGDLHQPLHMADNNDRGGNSVAAFYPNHKAVTNLHAVWDDALVKAAIGYRGQRADEVSEQIRLHGKEWKGGNVVGWASESHKVAVQYAYGALPTRQICGSPSATPEVLDEGYVDVTTPVVEEQLAKAAVRLAATLNLIFP